MPPISQKIRINFGQRQFIVDCNHLTYEHAVELAEKVAAVRMRNSLLSKFPMEEEETREKWLERIEPLLAQDRLRRSNESIDDHLKRLFGGNIASHDAAYDVINVIAEVFGNQAVDKDDFKKANFLQIKAFIFDVLSLADVPADEFEPRKLAAS